jgi:hypothetical protein
MNQKSILIVLLSFFILISCSSAQNIQNKKITVSVIDQKTNKPIKDIKVVLRTIINYSDITEENKNTNSTGNCIFSCELKERYLLTICTELKEGYYYYYSSIESNCRDINKDTPNNINLFLTSDSMQRIEYFAKITPHYQIDTLIRLLKSNNYKPNSRLMLPSLEWGDIPKLLKVGNDSTKIDNFPVNPISSFYQKDCYMGILSLWLIESIRITELRKSNQPFEKFPSQNPIIIEKLKQTTNPEQWRNPNTTMMMATACKAYQKWWDKAKKLDKKEACKFDPLEGTGLRW